MVVLLIGEPASGVAVLSFRPTVRYEGPVAILDELYVRPELRGHRLDSALLDAAVDLVRDRAAPWSRSTWTVRTPMRAVSMKPTGSPTPSPIRQTQCCTTTENFEIRPTACNQVVRGGAYTSGHG